MQLQKKIKGLFLTDCFSGCTIYKYVYEWNEHFCVILLTTDTICSIWNRNIVIQTLQWVQDAEDVEARSGQVAKWEEYQSPGDPKQNGESHQCTDVSPDSGVFILGIVAGNR